MFKTKTNNTTSADVTAGPARTSTAAAAAAGGGAAAGGVAMVMCTLTSGSLRFRGLAACGFRPG